MLVGVFAHVRDWDCGLGFVGLGNLHFGRARVDAQQTDTADSHREIEVKLDPSTTGEILGIARVIILNNHYQPKGFAIWAVRVGISTLADSGSTRAALDIRAAQVHLRSRTARIEETGASIRSVSSISPFARNL